MPFITNLAFREDIAGSYLEDVFSSILLKDVARRGKIRDVDLLGRIVRYVMTEAGHTFSAASIVRYLKKEKRPCTVDTVLNYLDLCEQAFLFARVKREDLIGRRILAVDEKFYVTDHGMRRFLVGGDAMRDIDQMLENLVYFELVRRGWHVTIGKIRSKEVDFVAERNGEINYYQVTYLMHSKETRNREIGALLEIPDNHPKFVLSMDPVDMSADGITHFNVRDFLMQESK
jgi:predicted AAA+ superfamily ATPase